MTIDKQYCDATALIIYQYMIDIGLPEKYIPEILESLDIIAMHKMYKMD